MANGRHIENRSWPYFFGFLTAFWASTSGGFRIKIANSPSPLIDITQFSDDCLSDNNKGYQNYFVLYCIP